MGIGGVGGIGGASSTGAGVNGGTGGIGGSPGILIGTPGNNEAPWRRAVGCYSGLNGLTANWITR
ncbi:hypothetical protein [Mycobacterium szulgai]|uniref:hypothetical protein n=1 Tax=Mycobacterium szulgai TaxID=1787 RepID=UPI00111BE8ED|nr:hypothetical protein [Mycobacterium szulgai]